MLRGVMEAFERAVGLAGDSNRGHRSMQVQTLIFDSSWTVAKAKRWAAAHGYKHGKVDETSTGTIRLRQHDPHDFRVLRTITLGDGIKAVVGR